MTIKMEQRFLLYIDILGFSELTNKYPKKVPDIYKTVDDLNVHRHRDFQTIIFSDTILVYNKVAPVSLHDYQYIVMYMCEFAQDLIFRGDQFNLNFRAILTYGEFSHYKLKNTECYYGKSLVSSYKREKEISGIGLFMDTAIKKYCNIFKTTKYCSDLDFVYLFQNIVRLNTLTGGILPLPELLIEEFPDLKDEVAILKKYFYELTSNENPKIRAKYLQTYQFYKELMPNILNELEANDFSPLTINSDVKWE